MSDMLRDTPRDTLRDTPRDTLRDKLTLRFVFMGYMFIRTDLWVQVLGYWKQIIKSSFWITLEKKKAISNSKNKDLLKIYTPSNTTRCNSQNLSRHVFTLQLLGYWRYSNCCVSTGLKSLQKRNRKSCYVCYEVFRTFECKPQRPKVSIKYQLSTEHTLNSTFTKKGCFFHVFFVAFIS